MNKEMPLDLMPTFLTMKVNFVDSSDHFNVHFLLFFRFDFICHSLLFKEWFLMKELLRKHDNHQLMCSRILADRVS